MSNRDLHSLLAEATRLRERGRLPEAITAYRRLLTAFPELPDSWYNLGWLLKRAGLAEAALAAYDEALARNVRDPEEVHLNRAAIYSDLLSQPNAAITALQAALRLKPGYLPALLNLGNLAEDMGDAGAARGAYERVLQLSPGNAVALARLAGLGVDATADVTMIDRIKQGLATHKYAPADVAQLLFSLGNLHDRRGAYDEAFAAFEAANRHALDAARGTVAPYDAAVEAARVGALAEAYVAAGTPRDGILDPDPVPVFIVGMFRSGSSLLERILGSHSEIAAGGELDLVPRIARALGADPRAQVSIPTATMREHAQAYLQRLRALRTVARLVTDKRPDNFWNVGLIKRLFPAAKIINTRRHPLDNLVSVLAVHLDPTMNYSYRIEDILGHIAAERRMMAHWSRIYPGDILTVEYERLVGNPREEVTRVLSFLGLGYEDSCLEFHKTPGPVRTASVWQVREPLHDRSVGRWRHYEAVLRARLGDARLDALLARETGTAGTQVASTPAAANRVRSPASSSE